jgi:uncharacterized protein (DUF1501 family)
MLAAGGLSLFPLSPRSWALTNPQSTDKHFIVILMRGAVDGLSLVAPYAEDNYYALRPNIAIDEPGLAGGLLDLNGFFGFHPSLAPLMPYWQARTLAFVHASGMPGLTRSHFEAQDILETALLNSALAQQGWLNGLLQVLPDNRAADRAISVGNVMPKIFQGKASIATLPTSLRADKATATDNPQIEKKFAQLYASQPQLAALYQQAVSAREAMLADLQVEMTDAGRGAPNSDAFINMSEKVAQMLRRDSKIQLVFMDVGGWDTHIGQGNAKGQLANKLDKFGQGLSRLIQGLGPVYQDTAILIMSEFGRTVAENGNKGTDHGHGNVAWLLGGNVQGGKVYGGWPGLGLENLWQGRDLAVTTDFRAIIGAVVGQHFGLSNATVQRFISDYQVDLGLAGLFKTA